MIEHIHDYVIPAAYALLPPNMNKDGATAMLLAIGAQESGFAQRRQFNGGPARSLWMFELSGVVGVLRHPMTREHIDHVLHALCYSSLGSRTESCYTIIENNDTLACCFARLLLWTVPERLANEDEPERGWDQYLRCWRPGKPRPDAWGAHFSDAWTRVRGTDINSMH